MGGMSQGVASSAGGPWIGASGEEWSFWNRVVASSVEVRSGGVVVATGMVVVVVATWTELATGSWLR